MNSSNSSSPLPPGMIRPAAIILMVLGAAGATLQIKAPARCRIRVIRHGKVVAEAERDTNLAYMPSEPGAYRVECYIPYEGRERGWIYSNPIYLR